jgi:four helix bundle protein
MAGNKIQTFQDLIAWQESHKFVLSVYKITKEYPSDERFGLVNQSRRAAVSVSSNIAEGFGRFSGKDKHHFYTMAKTSLAELQNQLIVARDLNYIREESFASMNSQANRVGGLIKGLMRSSVRTSSVH